MKERFISKFQNDIIHSDVAKKINGGYGSNDEGTVTEQTDCTFNMTMWPVSDSKADTSVFGDFVTSC
ncbi:hypothetical protein [Roseivirga pacifica]|uniref:hypothetical protein n=1 Tax=Roseivirga pacifica TaxID=1267423 RepID=UPI00227C2A1A|nr:hypothetical protein [Roseivirga pacifica]